MAGGAAAAGGCSIHEMIEVVTEPHIHSFKGELWGRLGDRGSGGQCWYRGCRGFYILHGRRHPPAVIGIVQEHVITGGTIAGAGA